MRVVIRFRREATPPLAPKAIAKALHRVSVLQRPGYLLPPDSMWQLLSTYLYGILKQNWPPSCSLNRKGTSQDV